MTTRAEQIVAHIATLLADTSGVSGRVYRSRTEAVSRAESPSILIEPSGANATYTNVAQIDWVFVVNVTTIQRGAIPDQAADAVLASLYSKIMVDRTLGGLAFDILPQIVKYDLLDVDGGGMAIGFAFAISYRTESGSLT